MDKHFDSVAAKNPDDLKGKLKDAYRAFLLSALATHHKKDPTAPIAVCLAGLSTGIYAGDDQDASRRTSAEALKEVLSERVGPNRIPLQNCFDRIVLSGFPDASRHFSA